MGDGPSVARKQYDQYAQINPDSVPKQGTPELKSIFRHTQPKFFIPNQLRQHSNRLTGQ
jgi:hypothetical protein